MHPKTESPLHAFDARMKLVSALLLIIGILLTPDNAYPAYPLLWALLASLGAFGHIGALRLARRGAVALPFALAGLTLLFSTQGAPLLTLGALTISDAGVVRFVGILLKTWLAAQVSALLIMTTSFADLLWALQWCRIPPPLVQIIAMLYRYVFTLQDEAARLQAARAARSASLQGLRCGGSLIWRARVAGSMIGSLFLRSLERSERVYMAMKARGFNGQLRVIQAAPLHWRAVLIGLLPVAILALIQRMACGW
jgi:cobalt/nickel transport system permease protein